MDTRHSTWGILVISGVLAATIPALAQPAAPATNHAAAAKRQPPPRLEVSASSRVGADAAGIHAERVFWECERLSKTLALGAGDAGTCSHAYELLLKDKFKGNFSELLKWWQREKHGSRS